MGRTRIKVDSRTLPPGIEIRHLNNGKTSIRVSFAYKGVKCRETLKLEATNQNIKFSERLRAEMLNNIEKGTFNYFSYFPNSKRAKLFGFSNSQMTVKQMIREWLGDIEKTIEHSTFDKYRRDCETYLIPEFGDKQLRDLKPIHIRSWLKNLNIKIKTATNILIPLRSALDQAITDEKIDQNPLDKVILKKVMTKESRENKFIADPFDKIEIKTFLDACKDEERNYWQFAFFTGARPSEQIVLEWSDIDWRKGTISINKAFVTKKLKDTKTISGEREIMLLPQALEALDNQKKYTKGKGLIFKHPTTGKQYSSDRQLGKIWLRIIKRSGLRYRNPYQTRHTFASMLLSMGENIMWVAKQMGHINIQMIIKRYGKWIPDPSETTGYKLSYNWAEYLGKKGA